jgi:putative hydrolase of the HAD superfamily
MTTEIQAIIFDYGGVIMDMRWDYARELEKRHALPDLALVETLYSSNGAWREIEVGRGDRETWLREAHVALEQRAGTSLPPLHEDWRAQQRLIARNVELVERLRPPYRTSVLSNADTTLVERLRDGWRIHHLFDDVVCSADVGLAKPDPRIYALAAERMRLPASACVFVDDLERNLEPARAAGMHTVHFRVDEDDDLEQQLARLGVVPSR